MIEKYIKLEEDFIILGLTNFVDSKTNDHFSPYTPSSEELASIATHQHEQFILNLIGSYISNRESPSIAIKSLHNHFLGYSGEFELIDIDDLEKTGEICDHLHTLFLNSSFNISNGKLKRIKSKSNLIELGAVYTRLDIVHEIVTNTLKFWFSTHTEINSILDFACGTGRFYDAVIEVLHKQYGIEKEKIITEKLYALDLDEVAVNITRLKAIQHLKKISEASLATISQHILKRNALVRNSLIIESDDSLSMYDCDNHVGNGFEVIVSNPPYLVLKPTKAKNDKVSSKRITEQISYFRNSSLYPLSSEGMLNLYQISIEAMLGMLKKDGEMGIICPSTLFADTTASKLRKHLLTKNKLRGLKYFDEKAPLFDNITQATTIFYLNKGGSTDTISLKTEEAQFDIDLQLINNLFPEKMEIPFISGTEWEVLSKLSSLRRVKDYTNIRNRRGELDLTLFRDFITSEKTPYRLIRGNMIGDGKITESPKEYVTEAFLSRKTKDFITLDFKHKRLICQQISNACCQKRLRFIYCGESDILGNSCNYISAAPEILAKLFLLLNSSILNWRFKVTSSNNHINNYELAELPLPKLETVDGSLSFETQSELDLYVGSLYGLSKSEIEFISSK